MTLNVHEWGDASAPAVVCLHGVGGHGRRFRRLAEEHLARRFRVVAVDLRGCGRSTWEPPWSIAQHLDDLRATADALGVVRPSWIGHSFGGRLVLELAAASPERVHNGVLLDPAVWVPPPMALDHAEAARRWPGFATYEEALEQVRAYDPLAPLDAIEEDLREHLVQGADGRLDYRRSSSAVVAAYSELSTPPPLDGLFGPLLVVRGARSEVVPDVLVDALLDDYGDVFAVVTVPGGHSVLWHAFDETAEAIERFLA